LRALLGVAPYGEIALLITPSRILKMLCTYFKENYLNAICLI